ncbi:glycerate kinase type-2 family protein [Brevundimonas bacteroides]|uniref:glycerate kinase type-2 family protein n=1 Tax=Brevundimonas bacteroides TaxID=74311 RepID=UPI0004965299|nr:DUF4147 domain-containing protein [Brevundimonas bacteroides]
MDDPEGFLRSLFSAAIAAASDFSMIPGLIPRTEGRIRVLAAGKAAASMASAIEDAPPWWLKPGQMDGLVVTPPGHDLPLSTFQSLIAAHPVPDASSLAAGERMLAMADALAANDLLVALVSGGASALLAAPVSGLTLDDEIALNRSLLKVGVPIDQMNAARVRLSRLKGGGLARAATPARVVTVVVSDVPGDDPRRVGSGPTLAPPDVLLSPGILDLLPEGSRVVRDATPEGPVHVVVTASQALGVARAMAEEAGLNVIDLGASVEGEARDVGRDHARMAFELPGDHRPALVLSGGETTVTVRGSGRGGRNTEFLAAAMECAGGGSGLWGIAADTDGIDGSGPAAGAILRPDSFERARRLGLDLARTLQNNDALTLFEALGDQIVTGPTRTNVNDFRALLIL